MYTRVFIKYKQFISITSLLLRIYYLANEL